MTETQPASALPEGFPLDSVGARIVGALVEKAMTTPDNYPLSLNAVTTACNQVSNREPVVSYSEDLVERTLRMLADTGIASLYHKPGDRVVKYVHKLDRALEIGPAELAVLAVLLLRGDQTPGELRQRTSRYDTFDSLAAVEAALSDLSALNPPLVMRLARQPGQKEQRYRELISEGSLDPSESAPDETLSGDGRTESPRADVPLADSDLEARVSTLERRLEQLLDLLGVDDV